MGGAGARCRVGDRMLWMTYDALNLALNEQLLWRA